MSRFGSPTVAIARLFHVDGSDALQGRLGFCYVQLVRVADPAALGGEAFDLKLIQRTTRTERPRDADASPRREEATS